jgi:hypothetical protein
MTCVKTGAKVHFIDYGKVVAADLHQVGNVFIIRVLGSVKKTE